jgi:serine/threonine protein kinase
MQAALDHKNKERQESAMKVLAACLHRTDDLFCIPKREVAHRIMAQKGGCLALLLEMVAQRKIFVHTEISPEELTIGELIGEGTGGVVYRGTWRDKHVAIKQFNKDISYEDFIRELSIMCVVQHQNLVQCYGGVSTPNKKWIVDELMQVNLSQVIAAKNVPIDHGMIAEIAINAAAGIEYLHNHCNLIHRDLKSMNLLINTHKTHLDVKVCDFAFSRVINKKEQMTGNVGTVSWMAPEVLEKKKYNEKADVYSFGVILWELVSREVPFGNCEPFTVIMDVTKGKRLPIPKECPSDLKRLITACWSPRPKHRPSMANIIQALRKFHKSLPSTDKAQVTLNVTNIIVNGLPKRKKSLRNADNEQTVPRGSRANENKPCVTAIFNSDAENSVSDFTEN